MKVFQLTGVANTNMVFLFKDEGDLYRGIYAGADNIVELLYKHPPELELRSAAPNRKKYKGKALRVPDIGHYTPGSLVISQKANECIGDYLRQFGELNEILVEGETWYNYVVTNVLTGVVDEKNSEWCPSEVIKRPAFFADRLPEESQIFKVPEMYEVDIYFNDTGGETVATLFEEHGLEAGEIWETWNSEATAGS